MFPIAPEQPERWFQYTDYDKGRATFRMGFHRVIETDWRGEPITGDTLTAYIDHFNRGDFVNGKMLASDLLIMCYPDDLPPFLQEKHVFPDATGLIWIAEWWDSPLFVVYTEDKPEWILQLIERGDIDEPEIQIPERDSTQTGT